MVKVISKHLKTPNSEFGGVLEIEIISSMIIYRQSSWLRYGPKLPQIFDFIINTYQTFGGAESTSHLLATL